MNEVLQKIGGEWKSIPTWVKIGVPVGVGGIFLLSKLGGSTTPTTLTNSPGNATTNTDTTAGSSTGLLGALSGAVNPDGSTTTTEQNPNGVGLPTQAYSPTPISSIPGTTGGLSPSQQSLQNNAIESALGVFGGAPLNTTNPYSTVGGGWADVTQTNYAGGGTVTNLGVAQPTPAPGQIIPPSVQDITQYIPGTNTPDWNATVAQAYNYPQNFSPGMLQPAAVTNPTIVPTPAQTVAHPTASPAAVNLNLASQESAKQSAAYQAQANGNYSAASQAAFNAAHPLSGYA